MPSTDSHSKLSVGGLEVDVVRKNIKNLHLAVYPPDGRVRVAVPREIDEDAVRLAVVEKLRWIRRQQEVLRSKTRQTPREFISGETHFFLGRQYRLRVEEQDQTPSVELLGDDRLKMVVRPGSTVEKKRQLLHDWYRDELRQRLESLVAKWETQMGVRPLEWRVRRMKTKWGSCSRAGRILFNLELAKKPPRCIEYLVVHELAHLIEPHHNDAFVEVMDRYLPNWRHLKAVLNEAPLAHENWTY